MHKEYINLVADADTAVLFIHGIIGTPDHFTDYVKLVPDSMSVCNMLLDGHGKGVSDFSKSSMKKWKAQVNAEVEKLAKTHSNIIIVAHSMGTLFAVLQAIEHPDVVKDLFLIASPLKIFLRPQMFFNIFKVYFGLIKDTDEYAKAAKRAYGIHDSKNLFRYLLWIPRYFELLCEIKRVRKIIAQLKTPCVVYQSKRDEMVSIKSVEFLKTNNNIKVNILENSTHYYYDKKEYEVLLESFSALLNNY